MSSDRGNFVHSGTVQCLIYLLGPVLYTRYPGSCCRVQTSGQPLDAFPGVTLAPAQA